MLFGAIGQAILCAILPARYAFVPTVVLVLNAVVTTILQLASKKSNGFDTEVIPGRVSAQLPDRESARFGSQPAAQPVLVFHLGVRFNHPLGVLSPGGREIAEHFKKMNADLTDRADDYGLLSLSSWRGAERSSNNTLMTIYYFRDIEGVNKFAHDPIHQKAWTWFNKADYKHIGIFHEAFSAPRKGWETIYYNCHPMLMGMADTKCVDEDSGEEVWVNPLVDASCGPLKTQFSRMGRAIGEI